MLITAIRLKAEVHWSKYHKVMDILNKIAKSKDAGALDERDQKDLVKYQAIDEQKHKRSRVSGTLSNLCRQPADEA